MIIRLSHMIHTNFLLVLLASIWCRFASGADSTWGPVTNSMQMCVVLRNDLPALTADEINDPSAMITRLRLQSDDVSAFLWQQSTPQEQAAFSDFQSSGAATARACTNLAGLLNRVIAGKCILAPNRFDPRTRSPETWQLQEIYQDAQSAGGSAGYTRPHQEDTNWFRLNRLLLEGAYGFELGRRLDPAGIRVSRGEPVTLTIGFRDVARNGSLIVMRNANTDHDSNFELHISTPSGKAVSFKPFSRAGGHGAILEITSARPAYLTMHLSEMFSFSETGLYKISVERIMVPFDPAKGSRSSEPFSVAANPLIIRIVPSK
jgi:hypothetical protein